MSWRRLWNVARRGRRDREAQAEMDDFLAREAAAREAAGADARQAARQARLTLGSAERWREEAREARGLPWLETAAREMAMALRGLRRAPGLAVAAALMLGLGIGATSAAFGLVDRILLQPLPYPQAEQLVRIHLSAPGVGMPDMAIGPADYLIFRGQNRSFSALGLYAPDAATVTDHGVPERVVSMDLTADLLPTLGISPWVGRGFTAGDTAPGAAPVALLGFNYWQQHFAGDRGVVGRSVTVDGSATTIIGVMPAGFSVLDHTGAAVYKPLPFDPAKVFLGNFSWECIGRLRPGESFEAASADIGRLLPVVLRSFPAPPGYTLGTFTSARFSPLLSPLKTAVIGDAGRLLWMLLGSLGLVLVIVCANTAGLLLVRAEGRQQEMAIRAALGASQT
ncbi:MAG: ABC transporter permease, partial [Terriglobales bacterium]